MAAGEHLRTARSKMGGLWLRKHDFPLHPLQVMSQAGFDQQAAAVELINAKRHAAGLLFMRTFPWPAVPTGTADEKKQLAAAKLPPVLKKYLKPQGQYKP